MYHFIFFVIILVLSLILQSYLDILAIAGVKPDLLLILTIYFSFKEGAFRGQIIGFVAGLLQDAISITNVPLGWQAMPKAIAGYLIGKYGNSIRGESLFSMGILVFAISIIHGIMLLFLAWIFIRVQFEMTYKVVFPEALYNAILGPILFTIYDRIFSGDISGGKHRV